MTTLSNGTAARGPRSGFQLIELMVVLVILGLVLAAAVPSFVRRNSWERVEGAAREMGGRIEIARQKSISRRIPYRLILDRAGRSYSFERQLAGGTWTRDPDTAFQAEGIAEMTATANGDPSANEVYLETRGTLRLEDAPLEVHLISNRGDTATVVLVRTGRVTVRVFRAGS